MMRIVALLVGLISLSGCSTMPTEQRIVGTWRTSFDQFEDQSGVMHRKPGIAENTLKPDHSYTSRVVGYHGAVTGQWRLSGWWLTYHFTTRRNGRRSLEQDRAKIVRLTERELVLVDDDGRKSGEWTKIR
jgi:hypothetical protein